jgi:hypothetical protein
MAWEKVSQFGSPTLDIKKLGQPVEGILKGKKQITTKIGSQTIWEFQAEDGEEFGIYGFTNLNNQMEQVRTGEKVKVTYLGTKNMKTKFGMKDVHQVDVQKWKDDGGEIPDHSSDLPV